MHRKIGKKVEEQIKKKTDDEKLGYQKQKKCGIEN